jgi:amino acid transporter
MSKKIPLLSLIIIIIATIDSIRNLPSSALFGSSVIFFFIFAAAIFLIPTALVAAELSATFPEKGGIYYWVNKAFGDKMAMAALWIQWANTIVWYPTILSFIAGTIAYLINPELTNNPKYVICMVVCLFWTLTFLNLFGLKISAKANEICGTVGTIFPLILLISLGFFWYFTNKPSQIEFTLSAITPDFSNKSSWVSLISIMAAFLGMELAGVHITEIKNPQKNFPIAIFVASLFILLSMLFGSLAIAIVIPKEDISLISGVLEVFSRFFEAFHLSSFMPLITILIVLGTFGSIINWLLAPAKGFLHAAEFGFLPKIFTKTNRYGAPQNVLLLQAILVSLVCTAYLLVPNVDAFYWFITALSTGLYMMMYVLMFLAALFLHHKYQNRPKVFKIPGGSFGIWTISILGLLGCILTIIIGFFPPDALEFESLTKYALLIGAGNLVVLSPLPLFYIYKKATSKKSFF